VLGVDLPLGEPTRLTRFTFHARQVERYRDGRILLAGDAARHRTQGRDARHRQPRLEAADLALRTDRGATSDAELMHTARPVFVDLADRPDLRKTARD
jgi:FAD binding domain